MRYGYMYKEEKQYIYFKLGEDFTEEDLIFTWGNRKELSNEKIAELVIKYKFERCNLDCSLNENNEILVQFVRRI